MKFALALLITSLMLACLLSCKRRVGNYENSDEWVGMDRRSVACSELDRRITVDTVLACVGGGRVFVCIPELVQDRSHWRYQCAPMPAQAVPAERAQ